MEEKPLGGRLGPPPPVTEGLKSVIHYFQFVNFTHPFQPSYSPSADPANLEYLA